jgi:hypothetical protein
MSFVALIELVVMEVPMILIVVMASMSFVSPQLVKFNSMGLLSFQLKTSGAIIY